MVANYGVSALSTELVTEAIKRSNADGIYFHRKGMKKIDYRKWKEWAEENEIRIFRESDYKKRSK